jgi:hypothetical protein
MECFMKKEARSALKKEENMDMAAPYLAEAVG